MVTLYFHKPHVVMEKIFLSAWARFFNHDCHAPTPVVVFQLLVARCGTIERFLFTNTNIRGLRLFSL